MRIIELTTPFTLEEVLSDVADGIRVWDGFIILKPTTLEGLWWFPCFTPEDGCGYWLDQLFCTHEWKEKEQRT